MCLYNFGSNEEAIEMLAYTLEYPEFEQWNTSTFTNIRVLMYGVNGPIAQKLAKVLLEQFYNWYLGSTNGGWQYFYSYLPYTGLECFPHSSIIREKIDKANEFYNKNKNKTPEEIHDLIFQNCSGVSCYNSN